MELKQSVSDMITRCPKCQTSFRITQGQLQTAKGSVRCGSCLHIFKAVDHLVENKLHQTKTEPETPSPAEVVPLNKSEPPSKPRFEYHKPAPPSVSAKDIEQALRSSIEPNNEEELDLPQAEKIDIELPTMEVEEALNEFGIPEDVLDEDDNPPINDTDGQQNMLVFDQKAIDSDEISGEVHEEELLISDDMAFEDDEPPVSKEAYGDDLVESFINMDSWAPKENSLFDRQSKPPQEQEDSDDKHSPDESWAVDLLEEDENSPDDFKFNSTPKALDELDLELEEPDSGPAPEEYSRATTGSFNALEDSDIEEALGEPLGEHIEPKINEDGSLDEKEFYPEFDYDAEAYSEEPYRDEESYGDEDYGPEYGGDYYSQEDRSELLKGISSAPVEFSNYSKKQDWRKRAMWWGATVVASLSLVFQVAWLQFETLSRQQPYRSLYGVFCPVFGCDVPTLAAPEMIRASNLVVRSHPKADNALMVDTILLNTAPFNQPFPDVVLNFSNSDGETLAARRFKPVEYLGGELAGRSEMPIGQPLHLSLEIVDPGPEAVNYSAYIPN